MLNDRQKKMWGSVAEKAKSGEGTRLCEPLRKRPGETIRTQKCQRRQRSGQINTAGPLCWPPRPQSLWSWTMGPTRNLQNQTGNHSWGFEGKLCEPGDMGIPGVVGREGSEWTAGVDFRLDGDRLLTFYFKKLSSLLRTSTERHLNVVLQEGDTTRKSCVCFDGAVCITCTLV